LIDNLKKNRVSEQQNSILNNIIYPRKRRGLLGRGKPIPSSLSSKSSN
jgi:hypothetical protein